jgi:hypothetical protein
MVGLKMSEGQDSSNKDRRRPALSNSFLEIFVAASMVEGAGAGAVASILAYNGSTPDIETSWNLRFSGLEKDAMAPLAAALLFVLKKAGPDSGITVYLADRRLPDLIASDAQSAPGQVPAFLLARIRHLVAEKAVRFDIVGEEGTPRMERMHRQARRAAIDRGFSSLISVRELVGSPA